MNHKVIRGLVCAAAAVALVVSFSQCKKQARTGQEGAARAAAIVGDLRLVHMSPQGPTTQAHMAERLVAIFDHPMVPLQEIPEGDGSSFLKVEPSVPGKFRWMGTRTLTFTPSGRFPYGTEVKVTIPAGTVSLDGYSLKQDFAWTFRTITPEVVSHIPGDGGQWVRLDSPVRLVFNQAVEEGPAKQFVVLTEISPEGRTTELDFSLGRLSSQEIKEEKLESAADNILILKLSNRLRPDCTYTVTVKAGLPGREGVLGLKSDFIFNFETYKTFALEKIEPREAISPHDSLRIDFTNSVSYKDLASKVRFKPEVKIPDYYLEWDSTSDSIWLNLPFAPETSYTLTIPADLKDEFGNELGREMKFEFRTTSYPPSVRMTTGHGVIESYAQAMYSFTALNKDQVRLQAGEVPLDRIVPLISADKAFWSSENFAPYTGFYTLEKAIDIQAPRNTRKLVPLDLREVLKRDKGFVFLQLDTRDKEKWDRYPKAFLQVTELGITGKFSADSQVIWVTELKTGNPVPEAAVEIRDSSNRVCWRGATDADGRAVCPGWKSLGIRSKESWEKPEQFVFATRQDDTAFIASSWGTGVEPYRFGISYNWDVEPESMRGYVFTERGIYRAGETVHIKGIVRRQVKGQWRLPSAKQASCEVTDSLQKNVFKGQVGLDAFGSFQFDVDTAPAASLGTYQITAKIPSETGGAPEIMSGGFRVEAFRPAEFEVHLRSLKDSYVFGEEFQGNVRASYLFGGAMAGQKARWSLRLNPAGFAPPAPKGFRFGNELEWEDTYDEEGEMRGGETSRLVGSGETSLDGKGELAVKAPLRADKEKDSVSATLEATVQSPSRKSISNRIQTVVHRGEYYIGLKPETTFLNKGKELKVEVVAARPDGQMVDQSVQVKLIKREWRSVRKAGAGGRYEWLTEKEDTEVKSQRVSTKSSPVAVSFTPDKSGFYILLAEGTDGRKNPISSSTYLYVTGTDYVAWDRRNDDMVEIVPDSESYKPGDKARILVKSPYEKAKALVTVERESVLDSRVVELEGSTGQIELPIVSDYLPNVFVSVLLVQGRTVAPQPGQADDVGKPSFKIGYAQLAVSPEERKLKVEVKPNQDRYKPRDPVSLKLHVADQRNAGRRSSVALAVVDVGVLNLIGYTTPDPFSWFFGPKPLSVDTADGRINIVGQRAFGEKGENAGGGGEDESAGGLALSEVELRGNFKTTAYWNPSIITDEKGDASVTFNLPDNLTTFRVMAVALTEDSLFGNSETSFRVAKPLLLQASLPRFARIGDVFQAGVVVHNFSPQKGSVTLSGAFKGVAPQAQPLEKTLSLEAGASQEVLFGVKAEKAGVATFAFRAKMGPDSDGLEISLPVEQPRPMETVAVFGETSHSAEEKIVIPELYPSDSRLEVQASATALSGLKESLGYLTDYPYLCLEQRMSSILPYILANDVIRDFKLSRMASKEWEEFVRRTLERVYEYQKDSGGFGLWQDSRHESPYLSCYAVFGLLKARQAGYDVRTDVLNRGIQYLKGLLREKDGSKKYPYSIQGYKTTLAFVLYDLALAGLPEPAYAARLFADRSSLTVFGKAMLLKAIHIGQGAWTDRQTLMQELTNGVKVTAAEAHFEDEAGRADSWIFSSTLRTTAYVLQSLLEVGSDDPVLPAAARYIVQKQKAGRWSTTQENIYAFYALNTFYKTHEKIRPNFTVEMSLARQLILKEEFRGPTADIKTAATGLAAFKPGQTTSLTVSKTGDGLVYYGARMRYVARKPLDPRDEGLAVYKKIETLDGKPLDSIRGGDVVAVTLEIAVPQESLFVVVADPLPGGFEAVNTALETESTEEALELEDVLPDQPWWYSGFSHVEMHDNRVLLFADSLEPGVHTYRYMARALTYGEFVLPGTTVEQMYAPEVFGRSAERVIVIKK